MRLKLDENVPAALMPVLEARGHEATTVTQQGLGGQSDEVVWDAAQREKRLFITLDLDFADIRLHAGGTHAGVLALRPARAGSEAVRAVIEGVLARCPLEALVGCIAVADENRTRVRRARGSRGAP